MKYLPTNERADLVNQLFISEKAYTVHSLLKFKFNSNGHCDRMTDEK